MTGLSRPTGFIHTIINVGILGQLRCRGATGRKPATLLPYGILATTGAQPAWQLPVTFGRFSASIFQSIPSTNTVEATLRSAFLSKILRVVCFQREGAAYDCEEGDLPSATTGLDQRKPDIEGLV